MSDKIKIEIGEEKPPEKVNLKINFVEPKDTQEVAALYCPLDHDLECENCRLYQLNTSQGDVCIFQKIGYHLQGLDQFRGS